jgi:branched-chain amino acid transport system substrate-binding protein
MRPPSRPLALLLLPFLLAACSGGVADIFETQSPITVAVVGPTRGPYSGLGGEMRAGVQQAEQDINAKGGVLGHVLKLRGVDDQCDAKSASSTARALVREKVTFVVGHFCSTSSIAAAPIYSEANILMITPSSSSAALTDEAAARGSSNIFRVVPRDDTQGVFLAQHILERYPGAPVALVDDGSIYGRNVTRSTRQALAEKGVRPALAESVPPDTEDFSGLVARLKAHGIGVIVFGGYAEEAAKLLLEVRKQGLEATFGGGDTLMADDFQRLAKAAAEGAFMTSLPDARELPTAQHAVEGLANFGIDAKGYTLYTYAAVELFAEAAERAKSLDASAVAKALREGEYSTVLGPLSFDAKGDLKESRYAIYVWHDGAAQPLRP